MKPEELQAIREIRDKTLRGEFNVTQVRELFPKMVDEIERFRDTDRLLEDLEFLLDREPLVSDDIKEAQRILQIARKALEEV